MEYLCKPVPDGLAVMYTLAWLAPICTEAHRLSSVQPCNTALVHWNLV